MPFAFKKQKAKLSHLNVRTEKHGEDDVLAVDVKLQADVSNKFLDEVSPGLRQALYASDSAQPDIEADHLATLRFPQLHPLKLKVAITGGEFVLHGDSKAADRKFEAAVKDAVLDCKNGGTVTLTFQVAVQPTPEESGNLAALLGEEVKFSLRAVEQASQPPLDA